LLFHLLGEASISANVLISMGNQCFYGCEATDSGHILAEQYDINSLSLPVLLHDIQPWIASNNLSLPTIMLAVVERLAAKTMYEQSGRCVVYAQLQSTDKGLLLHDFQLRFDNLNNFELVTDNSTRSLSYIPHSYRLRDNKDGTVTDLQTGLQWKRCSEGKLWSGNTCTGNGLYFSWKDAMNLQSNFAGHADWRLPTLQELNTLVYCSNNKQRKFAFFSFESIEHEGYRGCGSKIRDQFQSPTIDAEAFPVNERYYFWSSTPKGLISSFAWVVGFDDGSVDAIEKTKVTMVRLVRGSLLVGA